MKVKITNGYNNKGTVESQDIDIKNCKITNYEEGHSPNGAGDLTIIADDNKVQIQKGKSVFVQDNTIEFNPDKYSIFNRLAMQDEDSSNITEEDLSLAASRYRKGCTLAKLGVLSIEYNNGIAVVRIKNNQILRFEFNKAENSENASITENSSKVESEAAQKTDTVNKKSSVENIDNKQTVQQPAVSSSDTITTNPFEKLYSNIPQEYEPYIKQAAKDADVSENFIRHLISVEGKKSKAQLTAYKDSNGVWTIGFGHTNLTDNATKGSNGFVEKDTTTITIEKAFEFLVADILEHKKYCKSYLGEDFNKAPKTVQEGLIDRSFQAGQGRFKNATLKANLSEGYYAASVARDLWVGSDPRRSGLRFLAIAKGLSKEDQTSAKNRFINLGHYATVTAKLIGKEKADFIEAFNALGN